MSDDLKSVIFDLEQKSNFRNYLMNDNLAFLDVVNKMTCQQLLPYHVAGNFPYAYDREIKSFVIKINNKWWKVEDPNDLTNRHARELFDYDPYREKQEADFELLIYFFCGAIKKVVIEDIFKGGDYGSYTYEKARDHNIDLWEQDFEKHDKAENEEISQFY